MPSTDPIADMFTSLRNAAAVQLLDVRVPMSSMKENIARALKQEGFLEDISKETDSSSPVLVMKLRTDAKGALVLRHIKRVSTPGQRIYSSYRDLRKVRQGLGLALLTTPKGILTDNQARKQQIGGEVIAEIW